MTNSGQEDEGYCLLSFSKKTHASYPILVTATARVLAVPAASAAVECEFSFTDNTITQKCSKLSPDSVNDIVFNH
ncbi:unnamed protein product [Rotaria sordida]|uniref:HAT C-terminal dimerisation domain-containing protein n=1 Tax=Rotaria sordida TaxID=392033 RepID=A0A815L074_9BILA|nr:unnamed protein product [Rotaria sordida]